MARSRTADFPKLVAVVHLPGLPGSPAAHGLHPGDALARAGDRALKEAAALARAGFDGLILENFGDAPFFAERVPPETIASLAILVAAAREAFPGRLGVNVLRNDGHAAQAIAAVAGADFFRLNVASGVYATDQGLIQGRAAELSRAGLALGSDARLWADVLVKHARPLSTSEMELAVEEAALRAGASAVIVSGTTTGRAVGAEALGEAARAARACGVPLYIGSGATADNARALLGQAHGLIVSSALRVGGRAGAPLDPARVRAFVRAARRAPPPASTSSRKRRRR